MVIIMNDFERIKDEISKLEDFKKNTEAIEAQTAMLIRMQSQVLPDIVSQVKTISECVEGGFNTSNLEQQARESLNKVINKSDYTNLINNVKETSEKLETTVKRAIGNAESWQTRFEGYKIEARFNVMLKSFIFGVLVGGGLAVFLIKQVVDVFK